MNYFLLPGNPPALYFYELWREEILQMDPSAKVRVSSYPTLTRTVDSSQAMKDVFDFHFQQLRQFYEEAGGPVTLIGHSLGGYFALQLLQNSTAWIDQAILLHPFLRAPHWKGQGILTALSSLYPRETLQKVLVRSRAWLERFSEELPYVTDQELIKTFHLGKHENSVIAFDQSPLLIPSDLCTKIKVLYTLNDIWCTAKVVAQLKNQVITQQCPEPHGFITDARYRHSLFLKILSL